MSESTGTVERFGRWTWYLIYVGLFALAFGLAIARNDTAFGWWIAGPGIAMLVAGIVLIWVRSRMSDPPEENQT